MGNDSTLGPKILEFGGRPNTCPICKTASNGKLARKNLQVNDLVLLKEDNLLLLKWRIGRVTEVHPGKDNLVRVATVRTTTSIVTRAIAKLCKLLMSNSIKED